MTDPNTRTRRSPSWRTVADALAQRMQHHAHCDAHRRPDAQPDDCPFCADRAAYDMWARKAYGVQEVSW